MSYVSCCELFKEDSPVYRALCGNLDALHKKRYKIALLAAHEDYGKCADIVSIYRDVSIETQNQLQCIFCESLCMSSTWFNGGVIEFDSIAGPIFKI